MKETYAKTLNIIIKYYLIGLAFVLPIFFLSFTSEFYLFNKYVLLVGSALILTLLWTGRMVIEGRVKIVRTPLDVPILIFVGIALLATIFSTDPITSVLGWYPRFHFSFLSILSYALIYFVATSNLDKGSRRFLVWAMVGAGLVLGLLTTLAYFGQHILPASYTQVRNWTPIGSINQLVLYIVMAIPLAFSLIVKEENYILKAAAGLAVFFMSIAFLASGMGTGWIVLAAAVAAFLVLSPRITIVREDRYLGAGLIAIFVILAIAFTQSGIKNNIIKNAVKGKPATLDLAKENTLPLSNAWKISVRGTGDKPLLGSGPGTYLFNYTAFKPAEINATNNWNVRFDLPSNDYLNLLSTMGIIGLVAFLFVIVSVLRPNLSYTIGNASAKQNPEQLFLVVSLVAFIVGVLFFDSGISTFLLFILATATSFSSLRDAGVAGIDDVDLRLVALRSGGIIQVEPTGRPKPNNLALVTFIPAVLLLAGLAFVGYRVYTGEVFLRRALNDANANKGKETRDNLLAAIKANPYSDLYHRTLMLTDLSLARALNQKGNLNQSEQQTLIGLVGEAINEGKVATGYEAQGLGVLSINKVPGTSTLNVANWESLALVYANIGGQQRTDAAVHAKNTYSRAIQLDPLNPQLYESLGNIYLNEKDYDNAIKLFESATQAKGDYASAHYNLAQALQAKGGTDNLTRAANELAATLQILPLDSSNREQVQSQLDSLKKKIDEASKAATPK
jgi:tetratricopeptide (TPR) repeat protein/O-antigen ligase